MRSLWFRSPRAVWLFGLAVVWLGSARAASAPLPVPAVPPPMPSSAPVAASPAGPASKPAGALPTDPAEIKTLRDIANISRYCIYALLGPALEASPARRADAAAQAQDLLRLVTPRLEEFDRALQIDPKDGQYWRWQPIPRSQMILSPDGGNESSAEKFVIDPPVAGAAAVSLLARRSGVRVDRVEVLSSEGERIPTNKSDAPAGADAEISKSQARVIYLYFPPSAVSTVVVHYADEGKAGSRLKVSVGEPRLREYGKEALYWNWKAQDLLAKGDVEPALDCLKSGARAVILFAQSRNRQ
ncbi:MAG: hypothetical protein NTW86_28320 [Candidatus Sumerlaeota bacterium]|nr:hypothetical protein [Candidatus Sumerlaeota bacterium]